MHTKTEATNMTNYPRIDRMGIELEGLWKQERYDAYFHHRPNRRFDNARNRLADAYNLGRIDYNRYNRAATRSYRQQELTTYVPPMTGTTGWQWHDDSSVEGMRGGERGEVVSPAVKPDVLMAGIAANYPDEQNHTCGTHVHVSVLDGYDYERLATKEFYQHFIAQAEAWVIAKDDAIHPASRDEFFERLNGNNSYCCRNWHPCSEHGDDECNHECDNDNFSCRVHSCDHDCDTRTERSRALRGLSSCARNSCEHDCDERCCLQMHDHYSGDEPCDSDNCSHFCDPVDEDCFVLTDCRHECNTHRCYGDCEHECDSDCSNGQDGSLHTPYPQRNDEEDARYAHLNYCESEHGTVEVRLAPAWRCPDITAQWVKFVADTFQDYLDNEAPATVERYVERQSHTRTHSYTERENSWSIVSTPWVEIATVAA